MKENKGKIDVAAAQKFLADHVDSLTGKTEPSERTLCGHVDLSPRGMGGWQLHLAVPVPCKQSYRRHHGRKNDFQPLLYACGGHFIAAQHLEAHPELAWQKSNCAT
jgi:hypothetical protein